MPTHHYIAHAGCEMLAFSYRLPDGWRITPLPPDYYDFENPTVFVPRLIAMAPHRHRSPMVTDLRTALTVAERTTEGPPPPVTSACAIFQPTWFSSARFDRPSRAGSRSRDSSGP